MAVYDDSEFDSPEEAIAHYRKLLAASRARKQVLEIQLAEYGLAAPPHVRTDFDKANSEVQQLREKIKQMEGGTPPQRPYKLTSQSGSPTLFPATFPATDWEHESPEITQFAVLQMINNFERESPSSYVDDTQIAGALDMDLQLVRDCMDLLEAAGDTESANSHDGHSAILSAQGRMRLRNSKYQPSQKAVILSTQDRQILAHINREMQTTTDAIAKVTGLTRSAVISSVERLAQVQCVTTTPVFNGLAARITPMGTQILDRSGS